jgi:hypothetical protein
MSIKILEFRQKDSNNVVANGSYENTLNNDSIMINPGDQISIKNVFLDTTSQSQFKFDNDVILKINFGVYIVDWWDGNEGEKQNYQSFDGPPGDTDQILTGGRFIPYKEIDVSGGLDPGVFEFISQLQFFLPANIDNQNTLNLIWNYQDVNNQPQVLHKTFGPGTFRSPGGPGSFFVNNVNLIVRRNTFIDAKGNFGQYVQAGFPNAAYGEPPWQINEGPLPDQPVNLQKPYQFNVELTFPKGVYSPNELGLKLSETLTNNSFSSNSTPIANPFLKYASQFFSGAVEPDGTGGNIPTGGIYWVRDDLTSRFQILGGGNNSAFVGASQIDFSFDAVSQKFNIDFLHFPLLDPDNGVNISVKYMKSGSSRNGPLYTVNKHSGIYFNSLQSFDSVTGEQLSFWENLGFDLERLCVTPVDTLRSIFPPATGNADKNLWTTVSLQDGVNIVGGFVGLDSIVLKGKNDVWFRLPSIPNTGDGLTATSEATTPIDASLSVPQIQTPFSHYLIELNIGLSLDYTDQFTMYQNIASVISRYYSYGSYLSDESGAIVYTHSGQPLYIRSGKIRILTADKKLDPALGPDNTILVQIIKNS